MTVCCLLGMGAGPLAAQKAGLSPLPVSPALPPPPEPAAAPGPEQPALAVHSVPAATELAPAAAPMLSPSDEDAARFDESDRCVLGKLCLGPVLTLGGINPFGIGIQARYNEDWGFGVDYQFLPAVGTEEASASVYLFTVDARYYATGAFFLSGGFALQGLNAEATATAASFDQNTFMPTNATVSVEGSLTKPMLKLGLGLLGSDGFVMGIDLALGIPLGGTDVDFAISGSEQSAEAMQQAAQLQSDVQEFADLAVELMPVLVQVNLLRIGYIF
jgi:hypothetical protein